MLALLYFERQNEVPMAAGSTKEQKIDSKWICKINSKSSDKVYIMSSHTVHLEPSCKLDLKSNPSQTVKKPQNKIVKWILRKV